MQNSSRIWRALWSTGTGHQHGRLRIIYTVRNKELVCFFKFCYVRCMLDMSLYLKSLCIFRFNPTQPQILELDNLESLQESFFDPSLPTKIFAHGWNGSPLSAYSTRDGKQFFQRFYWAETISINFFSKAYLSREECNFIAVDWSVLASGIEYPLIVERDVPRAAVHTGSVNNNQSSIQLPQ
jgi:hypothetical protein